MEVYRFRVMRKWYAYVLLGDAEDARDYFMQRGFTDEMVSKIEKADSELDFQFKMNSITSTNSWEK